MADLTINLRQTRVDFACQAGNVQLDVSLIRLDGDVCRIDAYRRTAMQSIPEVTHTITFNFDENKDSFSDEFHRVLSLIVEKIRRDEVGGARLSTGDYGINQIDENLDQIVPDVDSMADYSPDGRMSAIGHLVPF